MHHASFIRPKTIICPVTFGLGIHVEKSFGTKSHNANNLQLTETQPIVVNVIRKIKLLSSGFTENVDHNQLTLAGKGTFHGMGVITASTF